ncbi:WXG100 family type VII secretion target [Amycolatopsis arida]|uniref:ESAT-6-like protein n=1 Tax=Amycolatopsis arida TaxID=587909 RepID=A0A1I5X2Z9_9PSEU|nr:WXG100 family type VII secretion target [Amycolatopsis arida]TDX92575.1 WXG100 family type VII secretion target [Amycolatopsis arida]SFQ26241.1 WXG100 family type VII secretion target [Amycolatopsis arida]
MPNGIVVDYATIHTASEDCKNTGNELAALFDDLKSKLNPLISTWEGEAQQSYLQLQKEWDTSFEDMKQLLAQIAAVLPQIADGYQGTESGIQRMF